MRDKKYWKMYRGTGRSNLKSPRFAIFEDDTEKQNRRENRKQNEKKEIQEELEEHIRLERLAALDELVALSQEYGLYEFP